MTWGQLRLQLQAAGPGLSLDLLDSFINSRYEQVLQREEWSGLRYHGTLQTQAAYQSTTDTATLTVGSTAVTGTGTAWGSTYAGRRIYRPGDTAYYTITAVGSTTAITLDRAYEGTGTEASGTVISAAAYVVMQHVYALPSDARTIVRIADPVTGLPLTEMTKGQLDQVAGVRTLVADPGAYAPLGDSDELTLPVVHQVEFYPPPLRARGYPIEYIHAAYSFTGDNTSGAPLPFVTDSVLLYGCKADIEAALASKGTDAGVHLQLAKSYETKFQEALGRMVMVEHQQRRKPAKLRMADRFTRHRLERVERGYGRGWGPGQGGPN